MGLDVSHDCWHGSYGSFNIFRVEIAKAVGIPLELMEGFYESSRIDRLITSKSTLSDAEYIEMYVTRWLPIKWEILKPDPLHILLNHSDCDGTIEIDDQIFIAERLEAIADLLPGGDSQYRWNMQEKAKQFALGLRDAHMCNEVVEFG
jgi:hypothetical protein